MRSCGELGLRGGADFVRDPDTSMPSFPAGVLTPSGEWVPVPYLDPKAAERLFRHKVLRFLRREEVISQERLELLLSWRHSGLQVKQARFARQS